MSDSSIEARIALVGNPNAGKTTLFNALTGQNQKVGNYTGATVSRNPELSSRLTVIGSNSSTFRVPTP
jgi:ribosome-interacting GTPase 1